MEGKVNPLLANQAIRRKALAAGVVHCTETRVTALARTQNGFLVETTRGAVHAGRIVIAAGAGSTALAAHLGLNVPARAEPLHMNITEATEPLIHHMVQHADRQITMKQLSAGMVVIGGGWPATLARCRRASHCRARQPDRPTSALPSMSSRASARCASSAPGGRQHERRRTARGRAGDGRARPVLRHSRRRPATRSVR